MSEEESEAIANFDSILNSNSTDQKEFEANVSAPDSLQEKMANRQAVPTKRGTDPKSLPPYHQENKKD
jgi:hypothetical protein